MKETSKNNETAQLGIGAVVRSLRHVKPDNNGWSFDYKFIEKIAERARQYDEDVCMENVDAILLSLAEEQ